ncbi:Hypothetical predicted protein [Marmota monax]|uniref:COMMD1 N-terminal domain-containing protein n=1 Tax=Marmota monax TaxID=9995 RepID=A0A5E4CAZ5_MARMO|nr:hypothetical protein GHT09_007176 [Marmota monax]VTJ78866.1 Hypothetical predicted protein [Marmota monax]
MAGELEGCKSLSGLLSGLAQDAFHRHRGITEELLRSQLYPDVSAEEFRPFLAKMRGILKVLLFLKPLPQSPAPSFQPSDSPQAPSLKRLCSSDFYVVGSIHIAPLQI